MVNMMVEKKIERKNTTIKENFRSFRYPKAPEGKIPRGAKFY